MREKTAPSVKPGLQRRILAAGVALAVGMGVLWDLYPLPDAKERLDRIPKSTRHFTGENIPLRPNEKEVFGAARVLHRRYGFDETTFFLTVVDATENRHAVHDPRYCFRGSGWEMISEEAIPIRRGDAGNLKARREGDSAEIVYWFSDGDSRHCSFLRYWLQSTARRVTLGGSGPEPVLVVLQCFNASPDWPRLVRIMSEELNLP